MGKGSRLIPAFDAACYGMCAVLLGACKARTENGLHLIRATDVVELDIHQEIAHAWRKPYGSSNDCSNILIDILSSIQPFSP